MMLIYKVRALLYQSAPLVIPSSNHHLVHTCLGKESWCGGGGERGGRGGGGGGAVKFPTSAQEG